MKVKTLRQTHPTYHRARLQDYRALYCGGADFQDRKHQWISKNPQEPQDLYQERLKRARYINHCGPIIDLLAAWLFSEPPALEGMEGDYWSKLWDNADRAGTPMPAFWRDMLVEAMVDRQVFIWINLPTRQDQPQTKADEERAGLLDAWLVGLFGCQVIDWGEVEGKLAWILTEEVIEERGSVESERQKVYQWRYIDGQVIRRWRWVATKEKSAPNEEDEASEEPPIQHNIGQLPVVRLQLKEGLWAMNKLADPVIAHLQARNDLSWALHRSANALLVVKDKYGDDRPTMGHGYYFHIDADPDTDAFFVEPSGTNFQILAEDTKSLREEVYRVVQQMAASADSDATRTRSSGESKQADWQATEIILASYADMVRDAMAEVMQIIAKIRGEFTEDLAITGLEGYQKEDLMEFLESAALATDARQLSPTFRKEVAKRQSRRLLGDEVDKETMEEIDREIDEADADPAPYLPPTPPKQKPPL